MRMWVDLPHWLTRSFGVTRAFWLERPYWRRALLMGSGLLFVLLSAVQILLTGNPIVAASPGAPRLGAAGTAVDKVTIDAVDPSYRDLFMPANQSAPPAYSHSWYISNLDAKPMYALGHTDGVYQFSRCTTSFVILDFGQPGMADDTSGIYGTFDFAPTSPFVADSQIESAVESYARGWHDAAAPCDKLLVAPGTSNYHECVYGGACSIYAAGQQWAVMANQVQAYLKDQHWTAQIDAAAADDMETGWDSAARTRQFVDGFTAADVGDLYLLDFGDAWRSATWTDADVYYVAWQAGYDLPFPEVYSQYAATRWATVKQEYIAGPAGPMVMAGIMAECDQTDPMPTTTCASPAGQYGPNQGWQHLWDSMNVKTVGQPSMGFISDIRYQAQFGK